MWIKLLAKNWQFIVIAILLATNAFIIDLYLDKRDELSVSENNLESKKDEVKNANTSIGKQNDAINDWVIKGKELEDKVKSLSKEYNIIEKEYNESIYETLNAKVPESCNGSFGWLVDEGKKL